MAERVLRLPRRVPEPATIGVFALSGRVDPAQLARGVAHMRDLGHRVIVAPETGQEWRYFASQPSGSAGSSRTIPASTS